MRFSGNIQGMEFNTTCTLNIGSGASAKMEKSFSRHDWQVDSVVIFNNLSFIPQVRVKF